MLSFKIICNQKNCRITTIYKQRIFIHEISKRMYVIARGQKLFVHFVFIKLLWCKRFSNSPLHIFLRNRVFKIEVIFTSIYFSKEKINYIFLKNISNQYIIFYIQIYKYILVSTLLKQNLYKDCPWLVELFTFLYHFYLDFVYLFSPPIIQSVSCSHFKHLEIPTKLKGRRIYQNYF